MSELVLQQSRNGLPESVHRVSAAVVRADGALVAAYGNPDLVTFMRSAAKPFQALPLLLDGAAERFEISGPELALICASHNSERSQVDTVRRLLGRIGCGETDLACGPHVSLGLTYGIPPVERERLAEPTPLASNCSGKHAGMLALARHHGWDLAGYQRSEHPVQRRVKQELARWTGLDEQSIGEGGDGCTVVTFALPLRNMALAVARLVTGGGAAERTICAAMLEHPDLVAGRGRLCTALMRAYPGRLLAKVGAGGVYVAGVPSLGLGICLKVEDGSSRAAMVALFAVLDTLDLDPPPSSQLPQYAEQPVLNTQGQRVGTLRAGGEPSAV